METCSVVLELLSLSILWCDHLNETSLAVLLHDTNILQNEIWDNNVRHFQVTGLIANFFFKQLN